MGYSMPNDQEIYTLDEIIPTFDVSRIGVSGAVFDVKKLDWINQQYLIRSVRVEDLWTRIRDWGFSDTFMEKLMPLVHTRIKTFGDFIDLCDFFFINHLKYTDALFTPRNLKKEESAQILQTVLWALDASEQWTRSGLEAAAHEVADCFGIHFKHIMIPLLFATFMGKHQGPPLFDSFELLGEHKARARLLKSIEFLGGISNKKLSALQSAWKQKDGRAILSV